MISNENTARLFQSAPFIIIERDPDDLWKIIKIYGDLQRLEKNLTILDKQDDFLARIESNDRDIVSRKLGGAVLAHKSSIELRYRILKGSYHRWIEDYCSLSYNESGDVKEAVSYVWMSNLPSEWAFMVKGSEVWNELNSKIRHDILNQLTAILGYLELSSDVITDPMLIDFAQKEQAAAERIRERMIFTREYQKIGRYEFGWFSIEDLVKESLNQINLLQLSLKIDNGKRRLYVDKNFRHALEKIIENIPLHAKGATNIEIRYIARNNENILIIEDNGCGIQDSEKLRIFELGFGKGNGYGLFLAAKILSIFGIKIEERGIFGKNTRFELNIPSYIIEDTT